MLRMLAFSLVCLFLSACGPTVGDPCTTANECGGQLCLNDNRSPGGYCSLSCALDTPTSCPSGTACVRDAFNGRPACLRRCGTDAQCRAGYLCRTTHENGPEVCVGR